MDVKTLCLGVLTEGDQTGYEIKRRFEEAFSHFFGASFGSIYPALAELSRQGLVTCRSVEQDKRPDKKVYSLTAAGQRVADRGADDHAAAPQGALGVPGADVLRAPPAAGAGGRDHRPDGRPLGAAGGRARGCARDRATAPTPGMRFAAGYGRAVLGAALAYVREHKDELVRDVAEAGERPAEPMALAGE